VTATGSAVCRAQTRRPVLEAALFDWDGTLSDSRLALLTAWHRSTMEVLGRRFPVGRSEEDIVFTRPSADIWPTLSAGAEAQARLAAAFLDAYDDLADTTRPFPGVDVALERLREAGMAVGVVTSKGRPRLDADALRLGLAPLVDVSICAGEAPGAKPDPAPVHAALAALGVSPERAAMVGDTAVDVLAGAAAGVLPVGVAWGHGTAEELMAAGAAAVATGPDDLVTLLLGDAGADR